MAFRAITSFSYAPVPGGLSRVIGFGAVLADDDPAVKKHKHLFEPLDDHLRAVEEASANPGIKRDLDVEIPSVAGPAAAKKEAAFKRATARKKGKK